jgi:hypothetical protein
MATSFEDSNIAGMGSDADKNLRKASAATAEEWKGAGEKEGIQVWRIEKLKVLAWPKEQYGTFFDGSYCTRINRETHRNCFTISTFGWENILHKMKRE